MGKKSENTLKPGEEKVLKDTQLKPKSGETPMFSDTEKTAALKRWNSFLTKLETNKEVSKKINTIFIEWLKANLKKGALHTAFNEFINKKGGAEKIKFSDLLVMLYKSYATMDPKTWQIAVKRFPDEKLRAAVIGEGLFEMLYGFTYSKAKTESEKKEIDTFFKKTLPQIAEGKDTSSETITGLKRSALDKMFQIKKEAAGAITQAHLARLKSGLSTLGSNEGLKNLSESTKKKIAEVLGIIELSKFESKIKSLATETFNNAEDKVKGLGHALFAMLHTTEKGKKTLKQIPISHEFKPGEKITVNFHGNSDLDAHYGMRHLFKNQPGIYKVKINQLGSRGGSGIATRNYNDGNFYFSDGSYAPIYDKKTEIEIAEVLTPDQLETKKKEQQAKPPVKSGQPGTANPRSAATGKPSSGPYKGPKQRGSREYVSRNEAEQRLYTAWEEVQKVTDKESLLKMTDKFPLDPNDPIVRVPGNHLTRNPQLRLAVAWRFILARKYANLAGFDIRVISAYRDPKRQLSIWQRTLKAYGGNASKASKWAAPAYYDRNGILVSRSKHARGDTVDFAIYNQNGKKLDLARYKGPGSYHSRVMSGKTFEERMEILNSLRISGAHKHALRTAVVLSQFIMPFGFNKPYHAEAWHWTVQDPENPQLAVYSQPQHQRTYRRRSRTAMA